MAPYLRNRGGYAFVKTLFLLLLIKLKFKKIVWVRHNLRPHSEYSVLTYRILLRLLQIFSDATVTHRPVSEFKSYYIPHPLYDVSGVKQNDERDIPFFWFGAVKRYKGLTDLLKSWPNDVPLIVAGKCNDAELEKEISDLIRNRDLLVSWENKFLEYSELCEYISRARIVVMSHSEDSMIVSGVFYHAVSLGASVLMRRCRFYDEYLHEYQFVTSYENKDLSSGCLFNILRSNGTRMTVPSEFSDDSISKSWSNILLSK